MELKKVREDGKTMVVETTDETFTVTNALREALWDDSSVSEAAQIREHPYLAKPKIFVKVSRGLPVTALEKAAAKVEAEANAFRQHFKKAIGK